MNYINNSKTGYLIIIYVSQETLYKILNSKVFLKAREEHVLLNATDKFCCDCFF